MRIASLLLVIAAIPAPAWAQPLRDTVPAGITVSGSATIKTVPDRATISFELRGEGATPDAASSDLAKRHRAVTSALARLDPKARFFTGSVSTSEIRKGDCASSPADTVATTATISMATTAMVEAAEESTDPTANKGPCHVTGYVAGISGTMELAAIDDAGTAIGLAQREGAASASLDGFSLRDPAAAQHAALASAMENARNQAQALAAASGAQLGPIISVMGSPDGDVAMQMAPMRNMPADLNAFDIAPVKIDVSPKPVEITARVMVVYSLAK